jgi:molecular chaperone GrpE
MSKEAIENEQLEKDLNKETDQSSEEVVDTSEKLDDIAEHEIDEQEQEIIRLQEELETTKDSLLRKAAELENVRKRVQRERASLYEDAKIAALQEFLPISEDLFRVLAASEEYEVDGNFKSGIKLLVDKFEDVFNKYGVEVINQTGIPFDVNIHDALLKQPATNEDTESDTVIQILENGFKIGNKIIKHAKVIVST